MSKVRHAAVSNSSGIRPGEGMAIDVESTSHVLPNGMTAYSFTLNLLNAPVPDRSYGADVFGVHKSGETVKFLFGQTKVFDESSLRSLLVVRMGSQSAEKFSESLTQSRSSRSEDESIESVLLSSNVEAGQPFSFVEEPEQTVCLTANFVATAVSNGEACLDFLQASPFAMDAMSRSQKLALQAVVRVDLATPLVLGMLRELKKLQSAGESV